MKREVTKIRRKGELKALAKKHQEALYTELNISTERVVEFGKNMAVLGSILYIGYTILDRYLDAKLKNDSDNKKGEAGKFETLNKMILPLLAMGLQQGSMLLLKRARTMLIDYLEEKDKIND